MKKKIIFVSIIFIFASCLKSTDSYEDLPSFTFDGHIYKVAPDPHSEASEFISWTAAKAYCENLTAFGFSDWKMPNVEELETMYLNRKSIGGFVVEEDYESYYHSLTADSYGEHYLINWQDGSRTTDYYLEQQGYYYSYQRAHVRPIRIDH